MYVHTLHRSPLCRYERFFAPTVTTLHCGAGYRGSASEVGRSVCKSGGIREMTSSVEMDSPVGGSMYSICL